MAMLKRPFLIGFAIACSSTWVRTAIAVPLVSPLIQPSSTAARVESNAPVCYVQFQGRSAIDVSNVCGKKAGQPAATKVGVTVSSAATPPAFDPKVVNASTTGQCNFVDANGNPCQSQ